jgi:ABC-type nitrate/sulfonate/bicarbonate transport system ATPase subunit
VYALEPIDLQIEAGSFVAMLGPSGCGKTTLLRIVSGLLEATGGQVWLAGASPAAARQRRAIGWLAQDDGLLPWRRVLDNVALPLRLAGEHSTAAAADLLRRVGLDGSGRQYPHELSGGMRQRVALARALVARPPFLLLDEPFAHLDELTRERLGDLLLDLRAEVTAPPRPAPHHSLSPPPTFSGEAPTFSEEAATFSREAPTFSREAPTFSREAATFSREAATFSRERARPPTTLLVTHSVIEAVRLADRVVVLSAPPGRLVADVEVGLARPRHEDQPGFGSLVRSLKRALGAA